MPVSLREAAIVLSRKQSRNLPRGYDSLGAAKVHARQVEIWDVDGSILLKIPFVDHDLRDALRAQLAGLVR